MGFFMKVLGIGVVVAGIVALAVIEKRIPHSEQADFFIALAIVVAFVSSIYFALGVILDRLDKVIRSLDRPEIAPSEPSPTEKFLAGSTSPAARHEPSL